MEGVSPGEERRETREKKGRRGKPVARKLEVTQSDAMSIMYPRSLGKNWKMNRKR